jgi:hypothetical protein
MKINGFVVLLIVLFVAFLLNPGYSKHLAKLGYKERPVSRHSSGGEGYDGSKYKYNNFYVFSTTTDRGGDRSSFGIFGFVFK